MCQDTGVKLIDFGACIGVGSDFERVSQDNFVGELVEPIVHRLLCVRSFEDCLDRSLVASERPRNAESQAGDVDAFENSAALVHDGNVAALWASTPRYNVSCICVLLSDPSMGRSVSRSLQDFHLTFAQPQNGGRVKSRFGVKIC